MKKCKCCDHLSHTDRGEAVCSKYLFYVGDEGDLPCVDFEISLNYKPLFVMAIIVVVVLSLIITMQ